jgi:hypothetical protein
MKSDLKNVRFEYQNVPINEFVVHKKADRETGTLVNRLEAVEVNGERHKPTSRFFTSLFARFGFNKSFFKYFDYDEVFTRIAERDAGGEQVRVCVERSVDDVGQPQSRLLAATNPARPIVGYDELIDKLQAYHGESISYADGIVESTHMPRASSNALMVGDDVHSNRFLISCPVDGYGLPNIYLALLRQVCSNGMIAMSKAFRSSITLGRGDDNVSFAITRALDGFNSDEGFAALRQRMESAGKSWCSVNEANSLYKLLVGLHSQKAVVGSDGAALTASPTVRQSLNRYQSAYKALDDENKVSSRIMTAFHGLTGDTTRLYGLANLDSLSIKRQRTLPVDCTVYDAINFATEVATHYAQPDAARRLNAWVGTLVSNEYDMEGTRDQFDEFADFHIGAKLANQMTGSAN